jgi:hypothetical protein
MSSKTFQSPDNTKKVVSETAVAYQKKNTSNKWNPNVPFHGMQEEWWEHFHRIEKSRFTPLEEANKEFEDWKKEYLANRLK